MFYQGKKIYLPVSGKNTNLRSSKRKGLPIKRIQKIKETPLRVAVDILDNGHAPKFRFGDRVYCDPEARPRKGDDVLIVLRIGYPKAATLARVNRKTYLVERGNDRILIPRASFIHLHPIRGVEPMQPEAQGG